MKEENVNEKKVLIDELVSCEAQYANHEAGAVIRKAFRKYPLEVVNYKLHYSYPVGGCEIDKELLQRLYVFRSKITNVEPLPSRDVYFMKVTQKVSRREIYIDLTIYEAYLNSVRSVIYMQTEDIYYSKVIDEYNRALSGHNDNWKINALDEEGINDISDKVIQSYCQIKKLISEILKDDDFDFVYNGVLQHVDERFRARYIREKKNGKLVYTLFKCAILANQVLGILVDNTVIFDLIVEKNKDYLSI